METRSSVGNSEGNTSRVRAWTLRVMLVVLAGVCGAVIPAAAQNGYSAYIPSAVPSATSTLYSSATANAPGRVSTDKAGNTFFVGHASGSSSTLFEIPASSPVVAVSTPTPVITGLGQTGSNSVFVDASGTLWVSNGSGTGGALVEIPASKGIPNVAAIIAAYSSGEALSNITTACTAAPTAPCVYSANSVGGLVGLQIADIYSDGAGNIYLVDVSDNVSSGAYNRVIQFQTSAASAVTVLADKITSNAYAQVTVAGDGNVYYCDNVTGNSSGGLVSVINSGTLKTVGNSSSSLTLNVKAVLVAAATGIATDPWGDLIISGSTQIAEVPLESGVISFADQFNLLQAVSGSNAAMYSNPEVYGGTLDVHGNFYYATATNIMQVQMGGYNFGNVNVGTLVTSAPYFNITWDLPSYLTVSADPPTASPTALSTANAAYLQSFPYGGSKNFFGGTPYSSSNPGQYVNMYFQPVHPGALRGAFTALGNPNAEVATWGAKNAAYVVNLQGVGVGPQPIFLPGVASQAITLPTLYTGPTHATLAAGFVPQAVAVDTYGDLYVADSSNGTLDIDCLPTTSNTAGSWGSTGANSDNGVSYNYTYLANYCQANGVGYSYQLPGSSFTTPAGVVLDGSNSVYVLDSAPSVSVVTKFSFMAMVPITVIPNGTTVGGTAFSNPAGIAIDGYANLYIADTGNNRIIQAHQDSAQYSQNSVYVPSSTQFGGTKLSGPTGLAVDALGNLFIADTGNGRIVEYSVTGVTSVVSTTGVSLTTPTGVAVLPSGALVITDNSKGLILVSNGTAQVLSTGSITLSSLQGLGLDLAGNIYVADPVGEQVVELNVSAPATASAFPETVKIATSTETSEVLNSGNATLSFSAAPVIVDNTSSTSEFALASSNTCTGTVTLLAAAECNLTVTFTPAAVATITGTATVADNLQSYTLTANSGSAAERVGTFGTTGSSQVVNLSGVGTYTQVAQTINFTAPAAVTWSASIPPITLTATGGLSGQPVTFSIVSGNGTLSGTNNSILTVTQIGNTVIQANQAGGNVGTTTYLPATAVQQTLTVNPIGTVATPAFSVAAGTYTAIQTVTISDATPGAVIHYTTNGNTPTIASPVYTAGTVITVGVTTKIQAIANETGYVNSAVASATYTLNPDFALGAYNQTFNIPNGLGGSTTISVAPLFLASPETVTLTCAGLTQGDTCFFSDTNGNIIHSIVFPAAALTTTQYSIFTINTLEVTAAKNSKTSPLLPITSLAAVLCLFGFRKRNRLLMVVLLILSAAGIGMMSGCTSAIGKTHASTFTVTGTSGAIVHTLTITVNVNNIN